MPKFVTDNYSVQDSKQNWVDPKWIITNDKKFVIPVYQSDKSTKGGAKFTQFESKPMLIEDYKALLGSKWLTKKQTSGEIEDDFDDGGTPSKQINSSYLIKGKKYSESELLKMGYKLEDIASYKQN